jgi:hypothetical protein
MCQSDVVDNVFDRFITLEEWVKFATTHIAEKVATNLPKDYLGGHADNVTKEEFLDFIKKAVNKGTPEYQQLYFFLLKCFQAGDVSKSGGVDVTAFDKMIEAAAAAPRRFGLAPKTSDLFKSDAVSTNLFMPIADMLTRVHLNAGPHRQTQGVLRGHGQGQERADHLQRVA